MEKEYCTFKLNAFCVLTSTYSTDTGFIKLHTQTGNFSSPLHPSALVMWASILSLRDQNKKEKHDR